MDLGLSLSPFGHHPAAWREEAHVERLGFEALLFQVQSSDEAGLDFVVLSDQLGSRPVDALSPVATPFEPTLLVAALATKASRIGFLAAASTRQHEPYNLARRFASLDQISAGRAGWVVLPEVGEFTRDLEYVGLVRDLWDSWEDDAFIYNKTAGRFFDPDKMHILNHRGEHFAVRGPLNVNRSPQGRPIIAHILSEETRVLAAHTGELVFSQKSSQHETAEAINELGRTLEALGRSRSDMRLLANVLPFVAAIHHDALNEHDRLRNSERDDERDMPGVVLIGDPVEIADTLEQWFRSSSLDGFTILPPTIASARAFLRDVVPELQRRGLLKTKEEETLRDHLGLALPSHPFTQQEHLS